LFKQQQQSYKFCVHNTDLSHKVLKQSGLRRQKHEKLYCMHV